MNYTLGGQMQIYMLYFQGIGGPESAVQVLEIVMDLKIKVQAFEVCRKVWGSFRRRPES